VRGANRFSEYAQKLHPAVWWHIDRLHAVDGRTEWGLAGTLTPAILAAASHSGVPYVTVHYSELPDILGTDPRTLSDLNLVREIKTQCR
jgi:hypothetical protein